MSTRDILAELPRLSAAERDVVRARLDEIESAAAPSPEEQKLIDTRVAAYRRNPADVVSWSVAESGIRRQIDA